MCNCAFEFFLSRFRQHPHKLSSKFSRPETGVYVRKFNPCPSIIEFKDIGIVFVKKENISSSLTKRKHHNIDPTNGMLSLHFLINCNLTTTTIKRFYRWLGSYR